MFPNRRTVLRDLSLAASTEEGFFLLVPLSMLSRMSRTDTTATDSRACRLPQTVKTGTKCHAATSPGGMLSVSHACIHSYISCIAFKSIQAFNKFYTLHMVQRTSHATGICTQIRICIKFRLLTQHAQALKFTAASNSCFMHSCTSGTKQQPDSRQSQPID